jgi:predicted O-methyltransferase YrrM
LRVVEIGSAVGAGSTRIGGKFVKRSGGTLYCVDSWPHWMYLAFIGNLRVLDLEATVVPIRSPSADAAVLFDDGSLDAAFIDGGHSYSNVLADIDAYLPKIRKKGIMFGHDLHDLPSRLDRRELLNVSDLNHAEVTYITSDGLSQR